MFVCRLILITFILLRFISLATSQTCLVTDTNRTNLGLYGGTSLDLTYSMNGRLFAAVQTPTSLYYSDDSADTWQHAFPNDSLLFDCETRGWGGQAAHILVNCKGWVAARTTMEADAITASVVSFSNGDSGSWKTAMDPYLLSQYGYNVNRVSSIGLTDYFLYTGLGHIITLSDTTTFKPSNDIIDITTLISGITDTTDIISIAAANNSTGFPFYIIADTSGIGGSVGGLLYKYNGSVFSSIAIPSAMSSLLKVYTHPAKSLGDTLFISGFNNLNQNLVYRSFDGGLNWTDITFWAGSYNTYELSDVDYSSLWKVSYPPGDGLVLNCKGVYVSRDLGNTWETADMPSNGLAVNPGNMDVIAKSYDRIIKISNTGVSGTFIDRRNEGLDAIFIYKISRSKNKGIFYLATHTGLAYTTAYNNDTLQAYQKWQIPYGEYPISSIPLSSGEILKTVAMNPYDSLNVISGSTKGFYTSQTGPSVFTWIIPTAWDAMQVNDIEFINSQLVLAVTGGDAFNPYGNIWRSTDKGNSWSNVSPFNFNCGNTIAVGNGKNDTAIYIGTGVAGVKPGVLWKSLDLGLTWSAINSGPLDFPNLGIDSLPIVDIEVDSRGRDTLYIAAAGLEGKTSIVRSTDAGNSYHYINIATSASNNRMASALVIHETYPDSVYMAIGRNVGVYHFPTDSFQNLFSSFPGEIIHDLCYGSVLAGTTTGFYVLNLETYDDVVDISNMVNWVNKLKIYPNPTSDYITIEYDGLNERDEYYIQIRDGMGKRIQAYSSLSFTSNRIARLNTSSLDAGLYFIEIPELASYGIFIKE